MYIDQIASSPRTADTTFDIRLTDGAQVIFDISLFSNRTLRLPIPTRRFKMSFSFRPSYFAESQLLLNFIDISLLDCD